MEYRQNIDIIRYDAAEKNLFIQGWLFYEDGRDYEIDVLIDGEDVPYDKNAQKREDVKKLFPKADISEHTGYQIWAYWKQCPKSVEVWVRSGETRSLLGKRDENQLKESMESSTVRYSVDEKYLEQGCLHIRGWAVSYLNEEVRITVTDQEGREAEAQVRRMDRPDVLETFRGWIETMKCGFEVVVKEKSRNVYFLRFSDSQNAAGEEVDVRSVRRERKGKESAVDYFKREWKAGGFKKALAGAYRIFSGGDRHPYEIWFDSHKASPDELARQRKYQFTYQPKISIAVPLYRTPEKYLREMIRSVTGQTYGNWELCLADGGGEENSVRSVAEEFSRKDGRVRYQLLKENLGISGNTNAALDMAQGDFIALLDHDDLLAPDALFECVKALNEEPGTDVIYTDEDKVDMDGGSHFDPHFKPDFNQDLLNSQNYICHFFVAEKSVVERAGGFNSIYDGAQDFDFIFRCTELANHICHIPKILYHWRCHRDSTALNPESKLYAYEAGVRAVTDHFKRLGIPVRVERAPGYGLYHTHYEFEEQPLVSVIIPNKDHVEDLNRCLRSVMKTSGYPNLEFVIVENNSTEKETFEYYEMIQENYPSVRVVTWEGEFNYSALNNFGVSHARGDYLLLLNNDTQMIGEETFSELLQPCMREDIGCVGAKLLFEDHTIQHAGIVLGIGKDRVAGHVFYGLSNAELVYQSPREYSAVTAACMMVKRSVYEAAGGFDEKLAVALNDVDFCLKAGKAGYRVLYNPYAVLYHYESRTRGQEDDPVKQARFQKECGLFRERWKEVLEKGDPCYNPNLTLDRQDCSLRQP